MPANPRRVSHFIYHVKTANFPGCNQAGNHISNSIMRNDGIALLQTDQIDAFERDGELASEIFITALALSLPVPVKNLFTNTTGSVELELTGSCGLFRTYGNLSKGLM